MKQRERLHRPYGLRAHFALSLGVSIIICSLLFLLLYSIADVFLTDYFFQSEYNETRIQKQGESLQAYISKNKISSKELGKIKKWERRQPLIFLEMFFDGKCIYNSIYDIPEVELEGDFESWYKDYVFPIQLEDKQVQAILYSDFTYQYYVFGTSASAVVAVIVFVALFLISTRRLINYICRLNEEVQILEGGNLEYQVSVEGNDEVTDLAKSMDRMRQSFQQQLEKEQTLHLANKRLVTEMSHDLRTPLTGMMLYLEILRSHRYTTDQELQGYLEKIELKAQHMKQLTDHLFAYSLKEVSETKQKLQSLQEAFSGVLNRFEEDLSIQGFTVVSERVWLPYFVDVNNEYIQRIFENMVSNIVKYAEPTADIIISELNRDQFCGFSVINTIANPDCHTESNGIGIESIRTMMKQMKGQCLVEQTEAAFEITLLFPKY